MTRRDLLTLGIGAAAAVPLTPIPWKLLDDTAKWSQNWSWIPRPPRGERSIRYSSCTLCPAGCGIQAKCVGKNVIGIAPVAGHPVSQGVLCPYAFGAHQLPFHPARITHPLRCGNPASMEKVVAEISRRVNTGVLAILDERPGRAVSVAYQKIAEAHGGRYLVADRSETSTLGHIARATGRNVSDLGLTFENVRTILSFGAPVLESWATPGRVLNLWKQDRLAIVQVEADLSKTAALASRWLPVRAGSESHIANLFAGKIAAGEAAEATGIPAEKLVDAVRFIQDRGPMLAVSGGELSEEAEQTVAGLNRGSSAIVARDTSFEVERLANVADGSVDILIIDHGLLGGSVPYDALRSKLRRNGIIVSLSSYRAGVAAMADFVIPTPAFGEGLEEAPTPWDAVSPSYALAPALLDPPAGVTTALEFVNRVTGAEAAPEALIRARADALYAARRGELFSFADRATKPVREFKSAPEFYKALNTGACWIDRDQKPVALKCGPLADGSAAKTTASTRGSAVVPPLFTKIRQESRIGRA
jgi:hypothetical protein